MADDLSQKERKNEMVRGKKNKARAYVCRRVDNPQRRLPTIRVNHFSNDTVLNASDCLLSSIYHGSSWL